MKPCRTVSPLPCSRHKPWLRAFWNRVMDSCCRVLKEYGFTLSGNTTTNLNLATASTLSMQLQNSEAENERG